MKIIEALKNQINLEIESAKKRQEQTRLAQQKRFEENNEFRNLLSTFEKSVIKNNVVQLYVDDVNKRFYYNDNSKRIYNFSDLIDCELLEDGETISNTVSQTNGKRHVSIGKAIVGTVLARDAGLIVGGNAGKTESTTNSTTRNTNMCTKMQIKLTLNSFENPMIMIPIISSPINKNSQVYRQAFELAQKYISVFNIILNYNK